MGVAGTVGIIGTVIGFVSDVQCGGAALHARLLSLAVLAGAALVGALVAVGTGRLRSSSALAGFAALEVLVFLSTPLGISIVDTSGWGITASLVIAGLFGFFAFIAPRIIIGLSAVAVALITVGVAATAGVACGAQQWDAIAAIAAFTVSYLVCASVARLVRR